MLQPSHFQLLASSCKIQPPIQENSWMKQPSFAKLQIPIPILQVHVGEVRKIHGLNRQDGTTRNIGTHFLLKFHVLNWTCSIPNILEIYGTWYYEVVICIHLSCWWCLEVLVVVRLEDQQPCMNSPSLSFPGQIRSKQCTQCFTHAVEILHNQISESLLMSKFRPCGEASWPQWFSLTVFSSAVMLNLVVFAASGHSAGRQVGWCLQAAKKANFIVQHFPSLVLLYWKLQQPEEHHHTYHTLTYMFNPIKRVVATTVPKNYQNSGTTCLHDGLTEIWDSSLAKKLCRIPKCFGTRRCWTTQTKGRVSTSFWTVRAGPLDGFQCFLLDGWCI